MLVIWYCFVFYLISILCLLYILIFILHPNHSFISLLLTVLPTSHFLPTHFFFISIQKYSIPKYATNITHKWGPEIWGYIWEFHWNLFLYLIFGLLCLVLEKIMFHRDNNLEIYFQVAISHSTFANQNDLEPFFINNNNNSSHGL